MSPKLKISRRVVNPPSIKGFKPYGPNPSCRSTEPVALLYEEYEALRLCDYDGLNHHQASVEMGVSRPTFTRVYAAALQKIATAFVEGRQIAIGGGRVYFDSEWYRCDGCGCYFNHPSKDKKLENCPLCGNRCFTPVEQEAYRTGHANQPMEQERGPRGHGRMRRRGQHSNDI